MRQTDEPLEAYFEAADPIKPAPTTHRSNILIGNTLLKVTIHKKFNVKQYVVNFGEIRHTRRYAINNYAQRIMGCYFNKERELGVVQLHMS